jgi:hypothetical protein
VAPLVYHQPHADDKAAYRRLAASCIQVAERTSLVADRWGMMEMVQRWLDLARQAEEKQAK